MRTFLISIMLALVTTACYDPNFVRERSSDDVVATVVTCREYVTPRTYYDARLKRWVTEQNYNWYRTYSYTTFLPRRTGYDKWATRVSSPSYSRHNSDCYISHQY